MKFNVYRLQPTSRKRRLAFVETVEADHAPAAVRIVYESRGAALKGYVSWGYSAHPVGRDAYASEFGGATK